MMSIPINSGGCQLAPKWSMVSQQPLVISRDGRREPLISVDICKARNSRLLVPTTGEGSRRSRTEMQNKTTRYNQYMYECVWNDCINMYELCFVAQFRPPLDRESPWWRNLPQALPRLTSRALRFKGNEYGVIKQEPGLVMVSNGYSNG